jgi:hypothetical protein
METARAKGHSAEDVYNARKRLERAANEVLDDERREGQSPKEISP